MLTMLTPVNYGGAAATDVQVADMNNDGRPDIVELNSSAVSLSVMLANADGTFFDAPVLCSSGEIRTFRGQLHVLRNESKKAIGAMAIFTSA